MVPDAGEGLEVGGAVFCGAGGAVEGDGLAGEGEHAYEIAGRAVEDACSERVVGLDCHAEAGDLDLALVDGGEGGWSAEEGDADVWLVWTSALWMIRWDAHISVPPVILPRFIVLGKAS